MSTLSTTNIKHPSSASNNVVLDSSGGIAGDILINKTGAANGSTTDVVTLDNNNSSNGDNLTTAIAFKRTGNNSSYIYSRIGSVRTGTHNTDLAFSVNDGGTLAEQVRLTSTGNLKFNSGYGSVATAYGCRAWVNFNGTNTVAIRGSGNVSSITDNGTGQYTVNFATAMPDANHAPVISINGLAEFDPSVDSITSSSFQIAIYDSGAYRDRSVVCAAVFR